MKNGSSKIYLPITVSGLAIVPPSKPIISRHKADWWHFAKPMLPAVYLKFREALKLNNYDTII
jgi:hypothetical protein